MLLMHQSHDENIEPTIDSTHNSSTKHFNNFIVIIIMGKRRIRIRIRITIIQKWTKSSNLGGGSYQQNQAFQLLYNYLVHQQN